jgi:hypothetical protein
VVSYTGFKRNLLANVLGGELYSQRNVLKYIIVSVLALAGVAGLGWANYRFTAQNPGGNDFLPRWLGTRLFLMEGQSPYSEQTTLEIQRFVYGRVARADEDQVLFVYPFYSFVIYAPFSLIQDYLLARTLWMTLVEIAILAVAVLAVALSRWRASLPLLVLFVLFSALWYHSIRPLINGNTSILIALFVALAFWAIHENYDVLAGFLLAFSTIKPQVIVLLVAFVFIWAISRRRWTIIWSFIGSLALLIASTSLLIPNWVLQNIGQIISYPVYTLPGSPGAIFTEWMPGIGSQLGWVLTAILAVILLLEWRLALGKDFRWFFWTACLTLVITPLIGVRTATANYIVLLPALALVFATWYQRWGRAGRWLVIVAMLALGVGIWWLFLVTQQDGVQHSILFFPLPVFLLVSLYWVRWWAVNPPRPLLDELRLSQEDLL